MLYIFVSYVLICFFDKYKILRNIELSELPFKSVILKGLRLCRLLSDELGTKLFTYEATGYPLNEKGKRTPQKVSLFHHNRLVKRKKHPGRSL